MNVKVQKNSLISSAFSPRMLFFVATIVIFSCLGGRDIWTQEHRWADIVSGMFYRHDFLHPYIGTVSYYDKPLLSYWLIAAFAYVHGSLTTAILRMPSALAGLLTLWSVYRLGCQMKDQRLGVLAGWMLISTFYFVFWSRISSADMLNVAGTMVAILWYVEHRERTNLYEYSVFFVIIALTSLCKGLVGMVVPLLVVFLDMCIRGSLKEHLRPTLFVALIPALAIYVLPFWASSHFSQHTTDQNGLYLVYRENILRYFQPFDHRGPIYTYFIFLPLYLLPWSPFFVAALLTLKSRWQHLNINSRWIAWSLALLFTFFTLSGSRRSYYVLPLVPIAILFTADWLSTLSPNRQKMVTHFTIVACLLVYIAVDIAPAVYYKQYGLQHFAQQLKSEAQVIQPWEKWEIVLLDAESKLKFYLQMPPDAAIYDLGKHPQVQLSTESLSQRWPNIQAPHPNVIFISRSQYASLLQGLMPNYHLIYATTGPSKRHSKSQQPDIPIALIPNSS